MARGPIRLAFAAIVASVHVLSGQDQDLRFKSSGDLVRVHAVVRDRDGRFLPNLTKSDFEILDDGVPVEITAFSNDPGPLSVVMLIDRSKSMAPFAALRASIAAFMESLQPGDRISVHRLWSLEVPFTKDRRAPLAGLDAMPADAGSPVWAGLRRAIAAASAEAGQRVVIAFTDAADESQLLPPAEIRTSIIAGDVAVSVVGFGPLLNVRLETAPKTPWHTNAGRLQDSLHSIAAASGGAVIATAKTSEIEAAFQKIADELRHQYALGFSPATHDGRTHKLTTRVRVAGAKVKARDSYKQAAR